MGRRGRPPHPDILTPREWEVLALLREGLSNEAIAERLGISLSGAKWHVSEILSKLGVRSREEAAAWQPHRRPWWVAAMVPMGALWRRTSGSWISGALAAGVALAVATGLGALVWGLARVDGGGQGEQPLGLAATTPGFTLPRPVSPPLVTPPDPRQGTLHLLDPETGEVIDLGATGEFSPDGKQLVTSSLDSLGVDVIDVLTHERVRVFDQPAANWSWSPDSRRLAIAVSRAVAMGETSEVRDEGVFVANADGSGYRKITDIADAVVSWSPRGDYIAIEGQEASDRTTPLSARTKGYLLVRPDGSGLHHLDENVGILLWSPRGDEAVFFRVNGERTQVMVLNVDSGEVRRVAEGLQVVGDILAFSGLAWSPDGRAIAMTTYNPARESSNFGDSGYEVHVVSADGSGAVERVGSGRAPSWSPDARYLAFVSNWCRPFEEPRFDLAVYDREGRTLETITPPKFEVLSAQWSPTGDMISFQRFDEAAIYTIRPDGTDLKRQLGVSATSDEFYWTPDGKYIAYSTPAGHGVCD